uniref:Uncharacterized protein n=1 Tax=Anguilla anguilla TaxID=7936 RepID=A0A0E9PHQ7_ANGAN
MRIVLIAVAGACRSVIDRFPPALRPLRRFIDSSS